MGWREGHLGPVTSLRCIGAGGGSSAHGCFSSSPRRVLTAEPFHTPLGAKNCRKPGPSSKTGHSFRGCQEHPGGPAPTLHKPQVSRSAAADALSLGLSGLAQLLRRSTCSVWRQVLLHRYQTRGASARTHSDNTKALRHQVVKAAWWSWQEAQP